MQVEFIEGVSPHAFLFSNVQIGKNVIVLPGAVLGRPPLSSGAARLVDRQSLPPLIIEDDCIIGANCVLYMGSKIGKGTMICDCACIRENVSIGERSLIAMGVTINRDTKIGSNVKIMDNTHITGNAIIEDDVFISALVVMSNDNSMGQSNLSMQEMLGPILRRGAKIGQGACLLPNIEIGENAVVGANSVVTRSVPPDFVVFGVPAKPRNISTS